ncbi:MAG: hypothetical protein ACOCRO_11525 [Halanaerobiales bacterium]
MIKRCEKNCYDCQFAKLLQTHKDFPSFRTEESKYECVSGEVPLALFEKYGWKLGKEIAKECPGFSSIKLDQECMICGSEIKGDKLTWPHWAEGIMEDIPTCSETCKKKLQLVLDEQAEEMKK